MAHINHDANFIPTVAPILRHLVGNRFRCSLPSVRPVASPIRVPQFALLPQQRYRKQVKSAHEWKKQTVEQNGRLATARPDYA